MNREIIFRGFQEKENGKTTISVDGRTVRGEWVYGGYWLNRTLTRETAHIINDGGDTLAVIANTIGQCTGLTDKNDMKIFEGDIVEFDKLIRAQPTVKIRGKVFYEQEACAYSVEKAYISKPQFLCDLLNVKIIGNIYDNIEKF